MVFKIKSGRQK